MWPIIHATPSPGSLFSTSQSLFHSGGSVEMRFSTGPDGAVTLLPGDKVAFQVKTGGQASATTSATAALLDSDLRAVLSVPDVATTPANWAATLPEYAPGTDPFAPVPCRLAVFRNLSGSWRLLLASQPCWIEPTAQGTISLPDAAPSSVYLTHNGRVYALKLVDLELTDEVTTAVEEVQT